MIIKKARDIFATVTTEGSALPPDILQRVADLDRELPGLTPGAYHLAEGEKISEATNRAWNRLLAAWGSFKAARATISDDKPGTSETREKWLLPLFQELGYGRLLVAKALELEGKTYSISHGWGSTPIHLLGCNVPLDRKTRGLHGASGAAPHGLVQEFLNRSDDHLWAFVSNGLKLRLLRDNISFTRQAYVEFDLEAMMEGQVYPDFRLLWLVCHQSRVEAEKPEDCFLEQWSKAARDIGSRVLDHLRTGVESAINELGAGIWNHPSNLDIRTKLTSGALDKQDYFRQLLRFIYRLLFLFVYEDRGLLLKDPSSKQAEVYLRFYSTTRLRTLASSLRGSRHDDLFEGLRLIMQRLGTDEGCPELGLSPLGSMLFSNSAMPDIEPCRISNESLLAAVRHLATITGPEGLRPVDFKNLGAEELGSVYESLLELHPNMDNGFTLETAAGHERKTTGSYYTPESLIQSLLDTALDPVLAEARKAENPEQAILDLKVCDPACGSGHFLLAAANRMAKALAAVRTGEDEPAPEAVREAKRAFSSRCIYGVDLNPMAVELCKVSLWMESMDPGRPLSFLDSHIQCGNSLLGTTPALVRAGIPDEAFSPIEGDEKESCQAAKRTNKEERKAHAAGIKRKGLMTYTEEPWIKLGDLAASVLEFTQIDDSTIEGVREKQRLWESLAGSSGYRYGRMLADAWCAAFVWKKVKSPAVGIFYPITEEVFRRIEKNPFCVPDWMRDEIERLSSEYQFFHWHLAFPDVFMPNDENTYLSEGSADFVGGFDAVLGNPPWENLQTDPQEFFASVVPTIADAANMSVRNRLIASLVDSDPELFQRWQGQLRFCEAIRHFLRDSSRYPLSTYGRLNTYSVFAELGNSLIRSNGRCGMVLPIGIATDAFNQFFFSYIVKNGRLVSFFGFENEQFVFANVHHSFKFALLTIGGDCSCYAPELAFYLRSANDLRLGHNRYKLSLNDFELINPNTVTCPVFRSRYDAEISAHVYKILPVILQEEPHSNPWGIKCQLMFMMNTVTDITKTLSQMADAGYDPDKYNAYSLESYFPLVEGKTFHQFDHRFGTYFGQTTAQANQGKLPELSSEEHSDPYIEALPKYWVPKEHVDKSLGEFSSSKWFVSWRDVTSSVVYRTVISAVIPKCAASDSAPLIHFERQKRLLFLLFASLNYLLDL
jgi:hypothetical protein